MTRHTKLVCYIVVLIFVLPILSSCGILETTRGEASPRGPSSVNSVKEQQKIGEAMLKALDEGDKEALRALFCEYTREVPELDDQIQTAMDFYEGKLVLYDDAKNIGDYHGMSNNPGEITHLTADGKMEDILTDAGRRYRIVFFNELVNVRHPEYVGVDTIRITDLDTNETVEMGEQAAIEAKMRILAEAILKALDDKDSAALKAMFCEYAREMPEFDEQFQAMMDFYEGKMLSCRDFLNVTNERFYNNGLNREAGIFTELSSSATIDDIMTDAGRHYELHFVSYLVYQDSRKSVGLEYISIRNKDVKSADYDVERDFVNVDAIGHVKVQNRKRLAANE